MNKILEKLHQLALNRLNMRLKHLRGRHDQLDHAWNRGMGRGGGGVGLAPNQMGPVVSQDFYRKRKVELMDQRRQGTITRAEMRRQLDELQGKIPENNVVQPTTASASQPVQSVANTSPVTQQPTTTSEAPVVTEIPTRPIAQSTEVQDVSTFAAEQSNQLRTAIRDLQSENVRLSSEVEQLIEENLTEDKYQETTANNNAWFEISTSLLQNFVSQIRELADSQPNVNEETKNVLRQLEKDIADAINNENITEQEKIDLTDRIHDIFFSGLLGDLDIDESSPLIKVASTYFERILNKNSDTVNFSIEYQLAGLLTLMEWGEVDPALFDKTQIQRILQEYQQKKFDKSEKYRLNEMKIENLSRQMNDNQQQISDMKMQLVPLRQQMYESGTSLVNQLYSDPISRQYFDPSIIAPDTRRLLDTSDDIYDAVLLAPEEARSIIQSFGFDINNPEHMQILGDVLGMFSDGTIDTQISVMVEPIYDQQGFQIPGKYKLHFGCTLTQFNDQGVGEKHLSVNRYMELSDDGSSIIVKNSYLRQENMQGVGRAAVTRQIPAVIKLSQISGKPVTIQASALTEPSNDFYGYHVWPKTSFNYQMNSEVAGLLYRLGFTSEDLVDTFSFMQSPRKASITPEIISFAQQRGIPIESVQALQGKSPIEIWSDVVEMAVKLTQDGKIEESGSGTIDATDPNSPPVLKNIMLQYYTEYLRQKQRAASKSIKDKKYIPYLESQGFSMEDMEAFEYAWAMARKRGVIK